MAGLYLIPKAGLKVRNPASGEYLPEQGDTVQDGSYWRRRLRDGDVTLGTAPKAGKKTRGNQEA